jgi:hypothetical protein
MTDQRHPTLDDPSPFDACGWCLKWIAEDADLRYAPLPLDVTPAPDQIVLDLQIDDHVVMAVVPGPAWDPGFDGAGVVVVLCSERCEDALRRAIENDEARARGEAIPRREATPDERREAEALLKDHCAWCLCRIRNDSPSRRSSPR